MLSPKFSPYYIDPLPVLYVSPSFAPTLFCLEIASEVLLSEELVTRKRTESSRGLE